MNIKTVLKVFVLCLVIFLIAVVSNGQMSKKSKGENDDPGIQSIRFPDGFVLQIPQEKSPSGTLKRSDQNYIVFSPISSDKEPMMEEQPKDVKKK